jgi:hypothetical protein
MKSLRVVAERAPLVWILVGLLFNATGLYLGFDYGYVFAYLAVGGFCFAFGVALGLLHLRERPKMAANKRLSANFVSANATQIMQAMSASEHAVVKDKPNPSHA